MTSTWPKTWPQMIFWVIAKSTCLLFVLNRCSLTFHLTCGSIPRCGWGAYLCWHLRYWKVKWPPWPQQWLLHILCHVTYQMKGNDFSFLPYNVLDQLEVIWPHHDRKRDLRWPPWPQQWLLRIPCHVTYQMKGDLDPVILIYIKNIKCGWEYAVIHYPKFIKPHNIFFVIFFCDFNFFRGRKFFVPGLFFQIFLLQN